MDGAVRRIYNGLLRVGNGQAPVKNTFIHYSDHEPSAALARRSLSERDPPVMVQGEVNDEELGDEQESADTPTSTAESSSIHFFVPLDEEGGSQSSKKEPAFETGTERNSAKGKDETEECARRTPSNSSVGQMPLEPLEEDGPAWVRIPPTVQESAQEEEAPAPPPGLPTRSAITVKNTFIHCDDEEPLGDYTSRRHSGPAYVNRRFSQVLQLSSEGDLLQLPGGDNLPSEGSAGHAAGTCRPCAHHNRPAGCVKGKSCTFCHICEDGALKQRKKEKLTRLREEKRLRPKDNTSRRSEGGDSVSSLTLSMPPSPASTAGACLPPGLLGSGAGLDAPTLLSPSVSPSGQGNGELTVTYNGATAEVAWTVNLRKLRSQHRCGVSRRFSAWLFTREVPFLFLLVPGTDESFNSKGPVVAMMQLKCMEAPAQPTPGKELVDVAFAAGAYPLRQAQESHDFATNPVCALAHHQAFWELTATQNSGPGACIVRAFLQPASSSTSSGLQLPR
eukprot:CAMPEP_0170600750 /NCGR_PEP_ID=MMETSP0224-20130122/17497_1 /TAXON_ID=285029 /ORGANISM="Togula jolla, Strain CCCM 725" /LENGTH=504 /DNA_ID=CAMNT_0010925489 /DNA_START=48 /DNA_END=1562 /DNA_ORIENTATION=-